MLLPLFTYTGEHHAQRLGYHPARHRADFASGALSRRTANACPRKTTSSPSPPKCKTATDGCLHPLNGELRKANTGKLRAIPVRFLFNDPDLNLRAEYSCFDRETGRPVCVGNGETCRRAGDTGIEELPCPSPDGCAFGQGGACKPYGRLNVLIGDEDEMGSFHVQNDVVQLHPHIRGSAALLRAVSGNLLACLPLELKLRGKSTTQSYRSAIYYVDLGVRSGSTLEAAITQARELDARRKAAGFRSGGARYCCACRLQ